MPTVADVDRALAARSVSWTAAIEWHEVLASTNDRLKTLARQGAVEWTVVVADRQTRGRGRDGRVWVSPRGGLYLSVLLRPRAVRLGLIPLAAGVAVAEAVEEQGVRAALKWPNDVLVEDATPPGTEGGSNTRKLAGILAEAATGGPDVEWVVLGIGVNVRPEGPVELIPQAAWISEVSAGVEAAPVAAAVLARLRVWYDALGSGSPSVVEAWRDRAVGWWGRAVEVRAGGETLRGRLVDVDEEGALLVDTGEGRRRRLVSGEVSRLRHAG